MKYEKAVARVELFEAEDIVTASGGQVCATTRKDQCGLTSAAKGGCISDSTVCIGAIGFLSE